MPCDLVLIAYDGSDDAKRAVEYAGRFLASTAAVVVTAWEPMVRQTARLSGLSGLAQQEWLADDEVDDVGHIEAQHVNAEGVRLAERAGLRPRGRTVECTTTIWSALVAVADELDVDIIVAGTRGSTGLRALLRSSVADAVLKHCHRPILLVPPARAGTPA
ncbi:universal stress protein [Nocardia sp. alder85J]|uniref:universal stress protein n=1 Tax=Nocardia sp. alder85J TaxID=2862949 RepID=UPI001CD1CC98|nr:universal stress protein [Nocardia sp. alder85J]MCX4096310.1 universal stress protein [Nocardia sp. alder85J]